MKCLVCERFSLSHICKTCQNVYLSPSLYTRELSHGINVFSFYRYEEIKPLLFTKHTPLGYAIYSILAACSFQKFAQEFHTKEKYYSIGIDDSVKNGYAHTAILNHALATYNIKPLYNKLRATNPISYSGKSLRYRQENKRDFAYKSFRNSRDVILVDDIITTGTTLNEAMVTLQKYQHNISFCLTLCDVNLKKTF